MDWSNLPPHVLEKIFDATGDENDKIVLIGLCKLSEVCVGWRNSILSSTKLFANRVLYKYNSLYRRLVETGLINKIKNIEIWCPKDVEMLVEDMEEKPISDIFLDINRRWSDETLDRVLQFLSSCSKVTTVKIFFEIDDQRMAVWYWRILQKAIHCGQQPKILRCEIHFYNSSSQFFKPIDWEFIKNIDFHGCGSIKNLDLSVYYYRMFREWPDWTYLADAVSIEQVTIRGYVHKYVLEFYMTLKAKRIDLEEVDITEPMIKFFNNFESLYIHDCRNEDIGKINHQNAHAVCDFFPKYFIEGVVNLSALAQIYENSSFKSFTFSGTQTTFDCDNLLLDNWIDHARAN